MKKNHPDGTPHPETKLLDIRAYGAGILALEAQAITKVRDLLDENFDHAVLMLAGISPGARVVLTGMGKAGFIAMKLSATFASIGIPSFFIHPAEAIHGDIGRFAKNDIAVILSNSGETPEILRLLPHVKKIGCPIISVTAHRHSTLATHSDVILSISKLDEAGPLGLAPTTSTTAMLALGDALAMTVVQQLGITREQFAQYHPGGDLGRSLTLVAQIMRCDQRHCVVRDDVTGRQALQQMMATPGRPGSVTIVTASGELAGILTDGDIRRCLSRNENFLDLPVSSVMGRAPKTVGAKKLVEEALHIMSLHKFDELIVVDDNGLPVGQIDIQDIIAYQTS